MRPTKKVKKPQRAFPFELMEEKISQASREKLEIYQKAVKKNVHITTFHQKETKDVVRKYIEARFYVGLFDLVQCKMEMRFSEKEKMAKDHHHSFLKSDFRCFDPDQFKFIWQSSVSGEGEIEFILRVIRKVDSIEEGEDKKWLNKVLSIIFMDSKCDIQTPYGNHDIIICDEGHFLFFTEKLIKEHLSELNLITSDEYYLKKMIERTSALGDLEVLKSKIKNTMKNHVVMIQKISRRLLAKNKVSKLRKFKCEGISSNKNLEKEGGNKVCELKSICRGHIDKLLEYDMPLILDQLAVSNKKSFAGYFDLARQILGYQSSSIEVEKMKIDALKDIQNHMNRWFKYALATKKEETCETLEPFLLNGRHLKYAILSEDIGFFSRRYDSIKDKLTEEDWQGLQDFAAASGNIQMFEYINNMTIEKPNQQTLEMACYNSRYAMVRHLVTNYNINPNNKDLFIVARRKKDVLMSKLLAMLTVEIDMKIKALKIIVSALKSKKQGISIQKLGLFDLKVELNLPDSNDQKTQKEEIVEMQQEKAARVLQKNLKCLWNAQNLKR